MVLMSDGENDPYSRYTDGSIATATDTGTSYNSFGACHNADDCWQLNRYGTNSIDNADNSMDAYTTRMCTTLKAPMSRFIPLASVWTAP